MRFECLPYMNCRNANCQNHKNKNWHHNPYSVLNWFQYQHSYQKIEVSSRNHITCSLGLSTKYPKVLGKNCWDIRRVCPRNTYFDSATPITNHPVYTVHCLSSSSLSSASGFVKSLLFFGVVYLLRQFICIKIHHMKYNSDYFLFHCEHNNLIEMWFASVFNEMNFLDANRS